MSSLISRQRSPVAVVDPHSRSKRGAHDISSVLVSVLGRCRWSCDVCCSYPLYDENDELVLVRVVVAGQVRIVRSQHTRATVRSGTRDRPSFPHCTHHQNIDTVRVRHLDRGIACSRQGSVVGLGRVGHLTYSTSSLGLLNTLVMAIDHHETLWKHQECDCTLLVCG